MPFTPRPRFNWKLRARSLALGQRTLLMGILNVTPDSFSDGGRYDTVELAVAHALELLARGADILDIGGESTRPGATPVDPVEEQQRVLPVIAAILRLKPEVVISVDTYHAETARLSVVAGAEIVNDVSGGTWDAGMLDTVASLGCGLVLMHTRGTPLQWKALPAQPPLRFFATLATELAQRLATARKAGIERERICLDPGFSFGKTAAENLNLLAHLEGLGALGRPLLAGMSRKGFLRQTLQAADAGDEQTAILHANSAAHAAAVLAGVHLLRVHDVSEARAACALADGVLTHLGSA